MNFLVDANLPRSVLTLLTKYGHTATHVRDIGLGDSPDEKIAQCARSRKAVLVTRDFDFADIRNYPPADFFGS